MTTERHLSHGIGFETLEEADSGFENLTAEVEIEGEDFNRGLVDEWPRRAPVYTLVSLAQDADMTINTPVEAAGDD